MQVLKGHRGFVTALSPLRVPGRLASCSKDRTVKVWNLPAGLEEAGCITFGANALNLDSVLSLATLPDGLVASGSQGGSITVWNEETGREAMVLGQCGPSNANNDLVNEVHSLLALSTGGLLVSGSSDYTISIWRIAPAAERVRGRV
eukprot:SAG22_NODE_11119_length_500_cov_0.995012_1_plen_147_part_00